MFKEIAKIAVAVILAQAAMNAAKKYIPGAAAILG